MDKLIDKRLQSSGLGKNDRQQFYSFGTAHIDVYQYIRSNCSANFTSFKLDSICEQVLAVDIKSI